MPSVDEAKLRIDQTLAQRTEKMFNDIHEHYVPRFVPLLHQKSVLVERQQEERHILAQEQEKRWHEETLERQARINKGLRGLWDRLTGKHTQTIKQNEIEAYKNMQRDKMQKDTLISRQLEERRVLQEKLHDVRKQQENDFLRVNQAVFSKLPEDKVAQLGKSFEKQAISHEQKYDLDMDFNF